MFKILSLIFFMVFSGCELSFAQTYIKGPALIEGFAETVTASGTTTLTKDSQTYQLFTGTDPENLQLPDATTLPLGRSFIVQNSSTASITVKDAGSNTLYTVLANTAIKIIATNIGSANGVWDKISFGKLPIDLTNEVTNVLPIANGGTNSSTALNNNRVLISSGGAIVEQSALTATTPMKTDASGLPTASDLDLTTDVTGLLPLANGGTNKNMSALNGGVAYSDADSLELSAVGTSGQALISGGAGAPTWFNPAPGSLLFGGSSGELDEDSNLFWDNTNKRLLVNTDSSADEINYYGTSYGTALSTQADGTLNRIGLAIRQHGTAVAPWASFVKSRGTAAAPTVVNNGDVLGSMSFLAYDGVKYIQGASIIAQVDGTPGTDDMPTTLKIAVTRDADSVPLPGIVIKPEGTTVNVSIGPNSPTANAALDIQSTTKAMIIPKLTTATKTGLTAVSGMVVYDTTVNKISVYNGTTWEFVGGEYNSSDLTLTASDTIAISTTAQIQTWLVAGNAEAITLSTTPFGATAPVEGAEVTLIGNSDTNTVTIPFSDVAKGCLMDGDVTLAKGQTVKLKYNSTLDRYVRL